MAATFFLAPLVLSATPEMAPQSSDEISEYIAMDVASDSSMKGAQVSIRIENGIAILSGSVKTIDQAERAAERAMAAVKVRAVVNGLKIVSPMVSDSEVSAAIRSSLDKNKALGAGRITVTVEHGNARISGEVGTWDEQEIARETVSRVVGVTSIESDTRVVFDSVRTDQQMEDQLRQLIANDPLYDGLALSASVKEGVVQLKGEVGSKGEYDRLVRRSSVTGVFEVNADKLSVNSDLKMEAVEDKHFAPAQMMAALGDAFGLDNRLDARAIDFQLAEGVVSLSGQVARAEERSAAESTARGVPGVLAVDNRIRVAGRRPVVAANAPLVTPR